MKQIPWLTRFTRIVFILVLLAMFLPYGLGQGQAAAVPQAGAIRSVTGFTTNTLPANDDGYTSLVPIGFTVNFFGDQYTSLYVNNNGNITFDFSQSTYTPYDLTTTERKIIAAFFADVDTRGPGSGLVTYGTGLVDGRAAFGVNWINVGFYNADASKLNSFQLILIDRSDIQTGDFDIEMNYDQILWETGTASGGNNGLGGSSARVGFSNGTRLPGTFFELPGSAVNGAFLDSNPVTGLVYNNFNTTVVGRYRFEARNGGIANEHNPLIFLPGVAGSKFQNDHNQDGTYDEVWPNTTKLLTSPGDEHLRVLKLNSTGTGPFAPTNAAYHTVRPYDIIRTEQVPLINQQMDFYGNLVTYFTTQRGYVENQDFIPCYYDWRRSVTDIAAGSELVNTLDACINTALANNPGATQVDILAHSMGGLVARYYISDPTRAARVENLVTLGTPYLGAPKIALALIDEMCFVEKFGICFSNPSMLSELVTNFPSAYEISPDEQYFSVAAGYIYRNWDKNKDGQIDGWQTLEQSYDYLELDNPGLVQDARAYWAGVGGWSNGGTHGVNVLMVIGSGLGTPTIIWEKQRTPWWNPWGSEIYYEMPKTGNGDGTVPLHSAMMENPNTGADFSANVSRVYFKLEHGALASDLGALQVAASVFESGLAASLADRSQVSATAAAGYPSLDPIPVTGQQVIVRGSPAFEIYDSQGNSIRPIYGTDQFFNTIPGASYTQFAETLIIFLPDSDPYQIALWGEAGQPTDVRVDRILADTMIQSAVYLDVLANEASTATLAYDPNQSPAEFEVDSDGDGYQDQTIPPSAVLTGSQLADFSAPVSTISISGTPDGFWFAGSATVEITAADPGGSGIARIEYSLDGGYTFQPYTAPFSIDAAQVRVIFARATDLAGNMQTPYSHVGSFSLFLPALNR